MKRFNSLFTVVMLAMSMVVVSSAITSCSKDDDNPPANNPTSSTDGVVGTWSGSDRDEQFTLTFKTDGTGTVIMRYQDSYSGGTQTEMETFSYVMTDKSTGVITVYSEHFSFRIQGNKMYTDFDGYELILQKV